MIFTQKELPSELRNHLKEYVYDVIGYLFKVYKELPCGLPEYIYQEALDVILSENEVPHKKEFIFHPVFREKMLSSFKEFMEGFKKEYPHGREEADRSKDLMREQIRRFPSVLIITPF